MPVLVVTRFDADPRVAGWLLASFGVGAVAGNAVAYKFLLERVGGLKLVGTCILGQALPLWLLTIEPSAWLAAAALGLSGLANGLVNPSIHSLLTLRVPPQLRPSVMTVNVMIFGLAQPLGVFGVGPVLDAFGPQPVLVAFAAVQTVAMTLVAVSSFVVRRRESTAARALDGERVSVLRARGLGALLASQVVSSLGSQMTFLALPWFVLTTTGSPTRMSIVLAAELAPVAVLGIPSGVVIARWGARRTMLVADLARVPADRVDPAPPRARPG